MLTEIADTLLPPPLKLAAVLLACSIVASSSSPRRLVCGAFILLLLFFIDFNTSNYVAAFWAHLCPGLVLSHVGCCLAHRFGGPVKISWKLGLGIAFGFVLVIIFELYERLGPPKWTIRSFHFYNAVHITIYTLGATAAALTGINDFVVCYGFSSGFAERLDRAREVLDPAVISAIGFLFIGHQHSHVTIGQYRHKGFGISLCVLALTQILSSAIHKMIPFQHLASKYARDASSFLWLYSGVWLMLIGVAHSLEGRPEDGNPGGDADFGPHSLGAHTPLEEIMTMAAADLYFTALIVGARIVFAAGGVPGGTSVACALDGDDNDDVEDDADDVGDECLGSRCDSGSNSGYCVVSDLDSPRLSSKK